MYCSKCNSHVCDCLDFGSSKYQDHSSYLDEDVFSKPKLFEPVSLPPVEIEPCINEFDFQKKYLDDDVLSKQEVFEPVSLEHLNRPYPVKSNYQEDERMMPRPMLKPVEMPMPQWCLPPAAPGFMKAC